MKMCPYQKFYNRRLPEISDVPKVKKFLGNEEDFFVEVIVPGEL